MGYLREATMADMDLLYEWANEISVRQNSFSESRISYEEHKKWFGKMMLQKDNRQYIYIADREPAGQIRVKVCGELAEIGYSICEEKRHRGCGRELAGLAKKQIELDFPQITKIIAKVKPGNIPSQKVFLDTGFLETYRCFEFRIRQKEKKETQKQPDI